jgi:acyl-CoA synthetase (AMP-forming)/AMP-acid ligase II
LEIYWAVAKMGAVVVPLSPLLRGKGLLTLLQDSDAVLVMTTSNFVDYLDPLKPELPAIPADRYFLTDVPDASLSRLSRAHRERQRSRSRKTRRLMVMTS